jgi:hypothetical protein
MSVPYNVGYGKPPKKHQFQKGKSGNPKGRPKPKPLLDFQDKLIAELKSPMTIIEHGKKKKVTKLEALIKSIIARALQSEKTATKLLVGLVEQIPKNGFADDEIVGVITKSSLGALEKFVEETGKYAQDLGGEFEPSAPLAVRGAHDQVNLGAHDD